MTTGREDYAREQYRRELAAGLDRFFEPPRPDCPWCGARELSVHLRTQDMLQHKPGRFTLARCRTCKHIFQNPRLSPAGLDFYYRDFYDGLGKQTWERTFATMGPAYLARARMVAEFTTPRSWLDVGCGYGHFSNDARQVLPDTRMVGIDFGASVDEGLERGWLDEGHRGEFADLADKIAGKHDVVSMHHYLEHTRDPRAELDTAARVLDPGGYLLIEIPDPECIWGRVLRKWWVAWFQPQHQHFPTLANLRQALVERDFEIVKVDRGAAQVPGDLTYAVVLAILALGPDPNQPWLPGEPTEAARARNARAWKIGTPVLKATWRLDKALNLIARKTDRANAYRILARRRG